MNNKTKAISAIILVIIVAGVLAVTSGNGKAKAAENTARVSYFFNLEQKQHANHSSMLARSKNTYLKIAQRLQKLSQAQKAGSVMMIAIPDQYLSATTREFINKN